MNKRLILILFVAIAAAAAFQVYGTETRLPDVKFDGRVTLAQHNLYWIAVDKVTLDPTGQLKKGDQVRVEYCALPFGATTYEVGNWVEVYGQLEYYQSPDTLVRICKDYHYIQKATTATVTATTSEATLENPSMTTVVVTGGTLTSSSVIIETVTATMTTTVETPGTLTITETAAAQPPMGFLSGSNAVLIIAGIIMLIVVAVGASRRKKR